jgi:putative nucleotidyltransferase with HDIG domain
MRLSDLIEKGGDSLDRIIASRRASDGMLPAFAEEPTGIYKAARQLDIATPPSIETFLNTAAEHLANVAERVAEEDNVAGLWGRTKRIAEQLVSLATENTNFARCIRPNFQPEARVIWHCVNSAVVAIDLCLQLDHPDCEPLETGAAALLHDLGMQALGLKAVWNEGNSSFEKHVAAGVDTASRIGAPERVRTIIAQHHERIDGKGYPEGIAGDDMLIASQVVSLAEGFERIVDAGTTPRGSSLQENYMETALTTYRKAFEPDILKALISLRGFYPDGTMVELTNRSICVVLEQNEGFPLRPITPRNRPLSTCET